MRLEPKIRQEFAEKIAEAAGIKNTGKEKIFIKKFAALDRLKKLNGSKFWMDKVEHWISSEQKTAMADLINKNYNNPQAVLDYIIQYKKPI